MGIFDTDDDDDFEDDDSPQRSQDNSAMRQLRKALKTAQEQNKTLQGQIEELSKANRGRAISDVLASKGLSNPKIADLIPESVEATPEAVAAWVEKYADLFTPDPAAGQEAPQAPVSAVPAQTMSILADIDEVSTGGTVPQGMSDLLARINAANSPEDLTTIFRGAAG